MLTLLVEGPSRQAHDTTKVAHGLRRLLDREKTRPTAPLRRHFRKKLRPAHPKTPILGQCERAGRTYSRLHPPSDQAGRTFSCTGSCDVAAMKPPSPMLAPKQRPLKPATPLQPKNAPKTPISHPQRRWRFQSRLGRRPQRRRRFHSDTDTGAQRRRRFQTSWPPGRQGQAAVPTGSNAPASQISHVIYRGHFSRHPKSVAIPTTHIQCLNKPQGNYVRN